MKPSNILTTIQLLILVNGSLILTLSSQGQNIDTWYYPDGCYYTENSPPLLVDLNNSLSLLSSGWQLDPSLSDEFNSSELDRTKWYVVQNGCHSMSQEAIFLDNPNTIATDGKHLLLKEYRLTQPCQCPDNPTSPLHHFASSYFTASKEVQYGYFEMRCKYPCNVNLNPCFWFKGATVDPITKAIIKYDEIDLLEYPAPSRTLDILRNNIVHGFDQEDPAYPMPAQVYCKHVQGKTDFCSDTIVIGVEWLPREVN